MLIQWTSCIDQMDLQELTLNVQNIYDINFWALAFYYSKPFTYMDHRQETPPFPSIG